MSATIVFASLNVIQPQALACFSDFNDILNKQVVIKNDETNRLLFSDGNPIVEPGAEGGWKHAPLVLGTDANYYNRALWYLEKRDKFDGVVIRNEENNRLALSDGSIFEESLGDEGPWELPDIKGADANYYNRAVWYIKKFNEDTCLIENKETHRYLSSDGTVFNGSPGDEGGWRNSPKIVGTAANYYNRALWKIIVR
ncbi:MAG: hypothetical protein O4805_20725 [Trichodesmium sp. St16_bin2-tuft]|nr:hypothetical protein [Trichodesmium sp. St16_bin2-tuft]